MPLVSTTLASGLQNLEPTAVEATAAQAIADAWESYFMGASVAGAPIGGSLAAGKAAMVAALVGMSAPGAAAAKIQAAVTAFWTAIAPQGALLWTIPPNVVIPPLTPPPNISAIAGGLSGAFASNTANSSTTLDQAANSMATVLHASGGLGGIAIVQPPPVAPPVPTPIL